MKNLCLVIFSQNGAFAENVKRVLDRTGKYRVNYERRVNENDTVSDYDNYSDSVLLVERKDYSQINVSVTKKSLLFGEFIFDIHLRTLRWKERRLFHLSYKESKILLELIENTGNIVMRKYLLYKYWGEVSYYKSRSLDVLVSKLRGMLSLDSNVTIVNYRSEGLQLTY
jgi:DNA-binding response OmpR family regulator